MMFEVKSQCRLPLAAHLRGPAPHHVRGDGRALYYEGSYVDSDQIEDRLLDRLVDAGNLAELRGSAPDEGAASISRAAEPPRTPPKKGGK